MSEHKPLVRLNILALPSQTTILFALTFLVIGLPVLLSAVGDSVSCGPVVIVGMLTFTAWDFLSGPDRQIRRLSLTEADFPLLEQRFGELATGTAQLRRIPRLLISAQDCDVFSFGTFTRRYVAVSQQLAQELETDLRSSEPAHRARAEAVLLHELAHFRNGDVWKALLSRSVLKTTALFFSASLLNTMLTPFLYRYGARFYLGNNLSFLTQALEQIDPEMAEIVRNPPGVGPQATLRYLVYTFNAHWPLIAGSVLLLLFFWRRLLRVRELYADIRVVSWQEDTGPLLRAIPWVAMVTALRPASPQKRSSPRLAFGSLTSIARIKRLLSVQPVLALRRESIQAPQGIWGTPSHIAFIAAITVVCLDLTLNSLFSSRFIRGPNATLPLAIGFGVIAVSLIPLILSWSGEWPKTLRPFGVATLVFVGILLVPRLLLGLIVGSGVMLFPDVIDWSAYTLVLAPGENLPPLDISPLLVVDLYAVRPFLFFTLIIPPLLLLLLIVDTHLKREILTWYGARSIRHHPTLVLWGISGTLVTITTLGILPVANALIFPTAHSLLAPATIAGLLAALLLAAGVPLVIWQGHRKFARRCPACEEEIPGYYRLGHRCEQCGELLHPHLVQELATSPETL